MDQDSKLLIEQYNNHVLVESPIFIPTQKYVQKVLVNNKDDGNYLFDKDPEEWDGKDQSTWRQLCRKYEVSPIEKTPTKDKDPIGEGFDDTANHHWGPKWKPMATDDWENSRADFGRPLKPMSKRERERAAKRQAKIDRSLYKGELDYENNKSITGAEGRILMKLRLHYTKKIAEDVRRATQLPQFESPEAFVRFLDRNAKAMRKVTMASSLQEFRNLVSIPNKEWSDLIEYYYAQLPEPPLMPSPKSTGPSRDKQGRFASKST